MKTTDIRRITEEPSMPRNFDISLPDLNGKTALVTGASDGIGRVIATRLAAAGAQLILPVRNPTKGAAAVDRIRGVVPDARVATPALDLSSLDSVTALCVRLSADGHPIHILVNNAGVMSPPSRQVTADGFEVQFATNHLGHFALTLGLLPLLRQGAARVIHQTSIAARRGAINWDDLNWKSQYDVMKAYGQSKLAVGLFARELDARSTAAGWGITSNLAHPGISPTNLLAAQPGIGRPNDGNELRVIRLLSRLGIAGTPDTAALPALMAATDAGSQGGLFFGPKHVIGGPPSLQSLWTPLNSLRDARRMWEVSERLVGVKKPSPRR
jgi:NAD(P)-dependent dehydrogenase (short-subunit alcohol dehydrogenase family)